MTHNTIKGNGNSTLSTTINTSPMASPMAVGAEPPPYSSLGVVSPPPSSSGAGGSYPHNIPSSLPITDQEENYSKVEYTVPFTPTPQERAGGQRRPDGIELLRNESYGSLPPLPAPHYATPTSTLRLIPETHANLQNLIQNTDTVAMETDEYEPMMPIPASAVLH